MLLLCDIRCPEPYSSLFQGVFILNDFQYYEYCIDSDIGNFVDSHALSECDEKVRREKKRYIKAYPPNKPTQN